MISDIESTNLISIQSRVLHLIIYTKVMVPYLAISLNDQATKIDER